jgi:ParB-like chromosome segregation protein Spo0J
MSASEKLESKLRAAEEGREAIAKLQAAGWSQMRIALAAGCSQSVVSRAANDVRVLSDDVVEALKCLTKSM